MSTPEKPKQFIDVLGTGRTLLQLTADRFSGICPPENVWVVTAEKYRDIVKEQLPEVSDDHILLEPCMRNTAPCIAYVSWKIKKRYPEANLVVSASDHIVTDVEEFVRVIRKGLEFTGSEDRILTLGMKPTRPETGYGYIKMEREALGEGEIRKVEGFKEKPDRMTAEKYLQEGGYTWNSGIFLWSVSTVEKAFRSYQPKMSALFDSLEDYFYTEKEREIIGQKFPDCEKISVDYAIMEHAQNIYVFPADFGWSDLGTWGSLYELSGKDKEGNAIIGERVKMVECRDCIVHLSGEHQIVLQGLEGYIVAEQNGVISVSYTHLRAHET